MKYTSSVATVIFTTVSRWWCFVSKWWRQAFLKWRRYFVNGIVKTIATFWITYTLCLFWSRWIIVCILWYKQPAVKLGVEAEPDFVRSLKKPAISLDCKVCYNCASRFDLKCCLSVIINTKYECLCLQQLN